jgi:hypothetical protein
VGRQCYQVPPFANIFPLYAILGRPQINGRTDKKKHFDKETPRQIFTFAPELKQITTILLALLIFLQPFSKLWIVVSFKFNQESIAKTLCVKKEIKKNTCQGKCYLKKQLDKADEKEQKQAPTNTKEKVEVLYCYTQMPFDFLKQVVFYEKQSLGNYNTGFYISSFISDIFRPPKLNLI